MAGESFEEIRDKFEIIELMSRYCFAVDFRDFVASGGAQGGAQLMVREFLPHQNFFIEFAIMDEDFGATFDEGFQFLIPVGGEADEIVDEHKRACRDDAGEDGVVPAIHGILHGVTENEQQDQVERRELADLPFAGHPQQHDKEPVNDEGTEDEFPPRQ